MLMMNKFFNGASTSARLSGLAPSQNGLLHWGQCCLRKGGFGKVSSAVPNGYGVENALFPPIKEGGMSAYAYNVGSMSGGLSLLNGGKMAGSFSSAFTVQDGSLSMIVFTSGSATMAFVFDDCALRMTLGLVGDTSFAFDADDRTLAIIDPITGYFTSSLSGSADLRGNLSMSGEFSNSSTQQTVEYGGAIYMSAWGSDGYTYPSGTATQPVLSVDCAFALCRKYNIHTIYLNGEHEFDEDDGTISNIDFFGWGPIQFCKINLGGQAIDSCRFTGLVVEGKLNTTAIGGEGWQSSIARVQFDRCYMQTVEDLQGVCNDCQIDGATKIAAGGWLSSSNTVIEGDYTVFDLRSATGTTVSMDIASGWAQFINSVDGCLIELNVKGGEVSFDASCVGGEYYLEGIGTLFNDGAMTVKENHLTWDEPMSYHTVTGSTARAVASASSAGDPWGADLSAYPTDTAGKMLADMIDGNEVDPFETPSADASLREKINWLFAYFRNQRSVTDTAETLFSEDGNTAIGTSVIGKDNSMYVKGKMS